MIISRLTCRNMNSMEDKVNRIVIKWVMKLISIIKTHSRNLSHLKT